MLGIGWRRLRFGERYLARERGDQLHLCPQLEVKIERDQQADHHPGIDDEIDPATDTGEVGKCRRMRGKPDEIKPAAGGQYRDESDYRGAAVFGPRVDKDREKKSAEHELRDHGRDLCPKPWLCAFIPATLRRSE